MEKRKRSLLDHYKHKKRGSDSSQGSHSPSKKSSIDSGEVLLSPPPKRVVRLQEYEEAAIIPKSEGPAPSGKLEEPMPPHSRRTSSPTHSSGRDKISEMERRVKEELEVELTTRGREEHSKSSPNIIGGSSPLHTTQDLPRQSPVLSEKWSHASSSTSDTRPHTSSMITASSFSHFPPTSPTSTRSKKTSGFVDSNRHKLSSHSDSNEWTEFAYASVSGSSVEVGSKPFTVYSTHPGSGETVMSEFDPIKTASSGTSSGGDPSKPPMTN